jgi:ribosomal protein S14
VRSTRHEESARKGHRKCDRDSHHLPEIAAKELRLSRITQRDNATLTTIPLGMRGLWVYRARLRSAIPLSDFSL